MIDKNISAYADQHSSSPSALLQEIERVTHLRTLAPQMLSGHLQGRLLNMLSKLLQPQAILEIGGFTGYATLCLAEGLAPAGQLHTIEANQEVIYLLEEHVQKSDFTDCITIHHGDALSILPQLDFTWDLIFMDAAKRLYPDFYEMVIDRVRPGGLIIADNVLWSGKVLHPDSADEDTQALIRFNEMVMEDSRVENLMLPVRDGLLLCRKR